MPKSFFFLIAYAPQHAMPKHGMLLVFGSKMAEKKIRNEAHTYAKKMQKIRSSDSIHLFILHNADLYTSNRVNNVI